MACANELAFRTKNMSIFFTVLVWGLRTYDSSSIKVEDGVRVDMQMARVSFLVDSIMLVELFCCNYYIAERLASSLKILWNCCCRFGRKCTTSW